MPRKPATIWVSKTVAGTAPQAAMSTSRSWDAACATATPGPAEHRGQRRGIDGEGIDQRHLVGPGDLNQRQIGDVGALGVELGVEAVVRPRRRPRRRAPRGPRCRPPWSRVRSRAARWAGRMRSSSRLAEWLMVRARRSRSAPSRPARTRRLVHGTGLTARRRGQRSARSPRRTFVAVPGPGRGRLPRSCGSTALDASVPETSVRRVPSAERTFGATLMTSGSVSAGDVPIRVRGRYRRGTV